MSKYAHLPNYGIIKEFAGGYYEGQIVDGLPHGKGRMTKAGGGVSAGTWYKGEFGLWNVHTNNLPKGFKLTGAQTEDGKPIVKGKWDYGNNTTYDGEFVDGFYYGRGTFTYPNGDVYEGEWKYSK